MTMKLINAVTVGSGGASSINFTSIPSTYRDLKLVVSGRVSASITVDNGILSFNGSSSDFLWKRVYADGNGGLGNGASSTNNINILYSGASGTANTFSNSEVYIAGYASSNFKPWSIDTVQENNSAEAYMYIVTGIWQNTAPITSITISPASGSNFVQNSTAYLYGIKNT